MECVRFDKIGSKGIEVRDPVEVKGDFPKLKSCVARKILKTETSVNSDTLVSEITAASVYMVFLCLCCFIVQSKFPEFK